MPNIPAILVPTEVSEVHALPIMMNTMTTGSRKKKPEMAALWRLVKRVFIGLTLD
jgi:hypothetical protein